MNVRARELARRLTSSCLIATSIMIRAMLKFLAGAHVGQAQI